jgi:hypothetical protein
MIVEFKPDAPPKLCGRTAASWPAGPGQMLKSAVGILYD